MLVSLRQSLREIEVKHSVAHVVAVFALSFAQVCLASELLASELIDATKAQDIELVTSLLSADADPNSPQADGATALHWATHREDAEIMEALLAAGADVDAANRLGATALFIAARSGRSDLIDILLSAGADPNATLTVGETPLMSASRTGALQGVNQLIEAGAEVNVAESSREQTALMWAAAQGHVDVVDVLIDAGANLESKSKVRPMLMFADATNGGAFDQGVTENLGGYTALLFAARNGHIDVAQSLLAAGANIDNQAGNGSSPLVVATHSGHTELALMLLREGADANSMGAGYTALHAAILRGDLVVVDALLDHGANPDTRLEKANPVQRASEDWVLKSPLIGATPYWIAASFREAEIMTRLAEAGADPLLNNEEQYRRLRDRESRINPPAPEVVGGLASSLQAAVRGDSTRQRFYVQANPDPVGEEKKALEAVIVAADHGVDLDHKDFTGNAAIHDAAARNLATVVRELVERGADINLVSGSGRTALDFAEAAERRLGRGILAQETPDYVGPTARQVLEELGAGRPK